MDPLDCTLDELANNSRKRSRKRRRYDGYDNYNRNTNNDQYNWAPKRVKRNNQYNNRQYNGNQQYRNYSDNNNRNRNRNRNRDFNPQQSLRSIPPPPPTDYYTSQPSEHKEADSKQEPKYGYVTLIMRGDNYIPGALILAHSLRLVHAQHSLIAMITDDVSAKAIQALSLLYDHVIKVPYIKHKCKPMKTSKQKEKYNEWAADSFTKWNILQLNTLLPVQFTKLLFLDSDKIVIKNIDSLFTDDNISTPAGTFSSPWTNKHNKSGLIDYYPKDVKHSDTIPAQSIHNALYKNGFVAVGTSMLFTPNIGEYNKFIQMLNDRLICDENMRNNIDKELEEGKDNNEHLIGFKNCYSMLDEQSIVFFYYYHKIGWSYIDTKYNFIPWHFKWLEDSKGALDIPVVLHFFGMKPWDLSPTEWRDLQVWWALVFNLVNYACEDQYKWGETEKDLVSGFFKLSLINELPLGLFVDTEGQGKDGSVIEKDLTDETEGQGKDESVIEKDLTDETEMAKKKLKAKVTCFWCYELAKRQGLDPVELIKNDDFDKIDWIFHCPIDPLSGVLCCSKLMAEK